MADPTSRATERVFLASPTAGSSGVIAAPFQFLLTGEDNLVVTAWADDPALEIALAGRFLKPDGTILPFSYRVPALDTTAGRQTLLPLGPGFLLNLSLIAADSALVWGRLFARVDVVRGSIGARVVLGQMIGGYVTGASYLAWPGSGIANPWEGIGYLREETLADPAAGLPASFSSGAITRFQIVQASATFTPGGAAHSARPFVKAFLASGLDIIIHSSMAYTVGDNASRHQWAIGADPHATYNRQYVVNALPVDYWLFPSTSLQLHATGVGAGDTVTNARLLVRQFLSLP